MNKKQLYESIMTSISKEVKKALNEEYLNLNPHDKKTNMNDYLLKN